MVYNADQDPPECEVLPGEHEVALSFRKPCVGGAWVSINPLIVRIPMRAGYRYGFGADNDPMSMTWQPYATECTTNGTPQRLPIHVTTKWQFESTGTPSQSTGSGSLSGIQSVTMTLPLLKMDGKVGTAQYEAFELGPITQTVTGNAISASVSIARQEFTVVGLRAEQAYAAITLIHEASSGKNILDGSDNQLFRNRLKELFAAHQKEIMGTVVTMNGKVLEL